MSSYLLGKTINFHQRIYVFGDLQKNSLGILGIRFILETGQAAVFMAARVRASLLGSGSLSSLFTENEDGFVNESKDWLLAPLARKRNADAAHGRCKKFD